MKTDADYLAAKKLLAEQSRLASARRRREKVETAAIELEVDEALEVIRAAGEVKPGSPEELLLLVTMMMKKHSSSPVSRPDFLIGDEGD